MAEGMFSYPGNETFFVGAVAVFKKYFAAIKSDPETVLPHPRRFWLD